MVLNKEDFKDLSLYELLANISLYFEYENEEIMRRYLVWNLELAASLWPENFPSFNFVMMKIKKQSPFFMLKAPAQEEEYIEKLLNFEKRKKRNYFN